MKYIAIILLAALPALADWQHQTCSEARQAMVEARHARLEAMHEVARARAEVRGEMRHAQRLPPADARRRPLLALTHAAPPTSRHLQRRVASNGDATVRERATVFDPASLKANRSGPAAGQGHWPTKRN